MNGPLAMTSKNAFVLFLIIRNVRLDNIALYSVEDVAIHSSQYLLYLPRIWLADIFEVLHLNLFLAILHGLLLETLLFGH